MSVLIKGMEMPKNCFRCDIRRSCDLAWYLDPDNRPDNCPLVEVPVPHGDLIDRDKCIDYCRDSDQRSWEALAYEQPVIEAEGE